MKNEILASSPSLRVEYFCNEDATNKNLAIVFTSLWNRSLEGNHYGGELFFREGFDVVAVKISNDDWFQSIPLDLFDRIHKIISERCYEQRIAYGTSMGGYAGIALSKHLNCTSVIAISPQYCIDEEFDTRWLNHAKSITFNYRINKDAIAEGCKFFILYDNKDADELQIQRLLPILPVNDTHLFKLPFSGHPSTYFLNEVGLIKTLAIQLAQKGHLDGIDFFEKKRQSKSYLFCLSQHLLRMNHPIWALSTIESALKLDQTVAIFYRQKCDVLIQMGQLKDAATALNQAICLDPENANYHYHLSELLDKLGVAEKAILASLKAISLDPKNPHLLGHLAHLLKQSNLLNQALSAVESALKIDASIAKLYTQKCDILIKLGRIEEAVSPLQQAAILEPDNLHHQYLLRSLLHKLSAAPFLKTTQA